MVPGSGFSSFRAFAFIRTSGSASVTACVPDSGRTHRGLRYRRRDGAAHPLTAPCLGLLRRPGPVPYGGGVPPPTVLFLFCIEPIHVNQKPDPRVEACLHLRVCGSVVPPIFVGAGARRPWIRMRLKQPGEDRMAQKAVSLRRTRVSARFRVCHLHVLLADLWQ
jgi:hypothetical protein